MKKYCICLIVLVLALFFVQGCNENSSDKNENDQDLAEGDNLAVLNPWIRPAAQGMNTAAFFTLENNTGVSDTLYDVSSELAVLTQIHETFTDEDNRMGMRHIDFVEIPPHSKIEFKPGGKHVMFMRLKNDLKAGKTAEVTLRFRKAGNVNIKADVKDLMPPNKL